MTQSSVLMSHSFDATLKELFTPSPEAFAEVYGLPNIRPALTLNVDLSTISAATGLGLGCGQPLSPQRRTSIDSVG